MADALQLPVSRELRRRTVRRLPGAGALLALWIQQQQQQQQEQQQQQPHLRAEAVSAAWQEDLDLDLDVLGDWVPAWACRLSAAQLQDWEALQAWRALRQWGAQGRSDPRQQEVSVQGDQGQDSQWRGDQRRQGEGDRLRGDLRQGDQGRQEKPLQVDAAIVPTQAARCKG